MALYQKILSGVCELSTGAFTPTSSMPVLTGEDNGAVLSVTFEDGGESYPIPLDVDVKAYLYYPSSDTMTETVDMTVDDDTASCDIPDEFTAVSGSPQVVLYMVDGDGNIMKPCAFTINVKRTTADTVVYLSPPSPDTVMYIGRAPYIDVGGNWYQWNNTTRAFEDTGVSAAGNYKVYIKWSAVEPTQDEDLTDTPSPWIGIYAGLAAVAP
ncbi:MAG: hypothetical protein EOM14_15745, partial [Clostridia bacterium]|nr:hypothetical protein [Clostridia bacterium]